MDINGKIEQVFDLVTGTSTNGEWKKREFLISTLDQYPKKVYFSLWGDKVAAIEGLKAGEEVKVYFDAQSREYNGRWYTDLRAWRIDKAGAGSNPSAPQYNSPGVVENVQRNNSFDPMTGNGNDAGFDDLPF